MTKKNTCVFLIDDDEDDREVFEIALNDIDPEIKFCAARDGCVAMDIFNNDPEFLPDYIFLDLNMPKMNGWECLSAIRSLARLKDLPVVIYTTSFGGVDEAGLLAAGATAFVTKPNDVRQLVKILSEMIIKKIEYIKTP